METLAERVTAEREAKGWSQERLAEEVTRRGFKIGQSAIGNIESGTSKQPKCIVQLGAALGVSPEWLQKGKGDKFAGVARAASPAPAEPVQTISPVQATEGKPDVPVWASAQAGDDGAMILTSEPIDYIRRSEKMQGVRSPFAFYVIGDSMSPAVDHGDQVVINPGLPPQPSKDHVFIHQQADGTMLALVKRLVRSSGSFWRVRQFNPAKDFDLSKAKWTKAMVITEKRVGL